MCCVLLLQVHNALGFCYYSMEKVDLAIQEYRKAVELQQGYVTAWNNLGDAYERAKQWRCARLLLRLVLGEEGGERLQERACA